MASITPITKDQFTSISNLCVPLNIISLVSSVTSCMTFGFIRIYYPKLADRVSFRLSFVILFCNIGYSSHLLITLAWNLTPGFWCKYMAWSLVFFPLSSAFFIVCIALNLHIIFVNEYRSLYSFEQYYFIIAFSFALLLSLLPITDNMYDFDDSLNNCWYRDSGQKYNIIWQWVTFFGWIDASILYCTIVVIMVIRKLKTATKIIDDFDSSASQLSGYPTLINKNVVSLVVKRVMWYPIMPLVTQFFSSFVKTYAYFNHVVSYPLLLLCFIGVSLKGLLNALVFSQDIAVTRAFQAVKLQWWINNVNSYESQYPHRSHNKAFTDEFSKLGKSNDFIELNTLNSNNFESDITNDDVIDDNIIINVNNNNNNNKLVSQPSCLEWLKYVLLIKLFSPPKSSDNFFNVNNPNIFSALVSKDNSKQNITLDNQNNDQDIHLVHPEPVHIKDSFQNSSLDLSSNCLDPSTSSNFLL
ncbi:hypothetical protein F8M41_020807 [Gigaspora margarita]|uniref:G-protein coupled receptors family 2 profile 2 domain-containing protein n=2 Tax=Gigaspora margarita TaxID=4874 RepID=A0A8H4AHY7_GIGMA|nr:hypothetical protein F8M41_020807 [Gigaspora margarita]